MTLVNPFKPNSSICYTLPSRPNLPFYPNATTLRSGLCYRKSACRLSVCR